MAADANHGAELAKRWCATCHLLDSGQTPASADVLPFATIARKSDFTPEKVAFFLLDSHPKMPNFPLSRNEAADIAAYIGSLRKWSAQVRLTPKAFQPRGNIAVPARGRPLPVPVS